MEVTSKLRLWYYPESESLFWSDEYDGLSNDVTHDPTFREMAQEMKIEEPEHYRFQHIAKTPESCGCHKKTCAVCEFGLVICNSCGGAEGTLTLDCPRRPMRPDEEEKVVAGTLEYFSGVWINV